MFDHEPKCPHGGQLGKQESMKKKTLRQEQSIADSLGGHRQPASGAIAGHKGDVKHKHFLIDSKQTIGDVMATSRADVMKITREAYQESLEPCLVLTWENLKAVENSWAMIPMSVFKRMLDAGQAEEL